jgi:signal transduction histidine kinase
LIARLGSLRQSAQIQPVSSDLCAVVAASLDGISMPPGVTLTRHLVPMPMVPIDPSQMQKVVTNLVINAQEAMRGPGEIVVSTARQDSSIVLSVRDNGSGMSPEFVRRSLFRPFQTTKKTGLGIGMFHCRMIVEAHAGRIEVETEEGKGTNFRVVLPLNKEIA